MASVAEGALVPLLSASGIAKEFLVPGWRVGWVVAHELGAAAPPVMREVRGGLFALSQLVLGACALPLAALPAVLAPAPGSEDARALAQFRRDTCATLARHAALCVDALRGAPGLRCVAPRAAMYLMVAVDCAALGVRDDVDFAQRLLQAENVFVLPGQCFAGPGFVRIVFCAPPRMLAEACARIAAFCAARAAAVAAGAATSS